MLLNNLCVPPPCKRPVADAMLPTLLRILESRLPDCHLAAVCLYNLVLVDDARKRELLVYIPPTATLSTNGRPRDHPQCLLRVLERIVIEYSPFVQQPVHSVQVEAFRWSMGVLRHLAVAQPSLAQATKIGDVAAQALTYAPDDLALWTPDSWPDACLMVLVHLVRSGEADALDATLVLAAVGRLRGRGGIHEQRATAIAQQLTGMDEKKEY